MVRHASSISQRLQTQLLRRADQLVDTLGLLRGPSRPERVIELARRRSGLDDFGEWSFAEPLAVLLRAYDQEANLSAFGWVAARWDMVRYLSNLLRLRDEEKKRPEILDEPIRQPIFILGLPRSGTTFLHNVLGEDPANSVPRCWQAIYPHPAQTRIRVRPDPRPRKVARQFAAFLHLVPELSSLHPLDARGAQECIEITGQVIRSMRFDTTHYVPSYERWLDESGHLEAYRFHKRFLQHLQYQNGPGRWILKSPDHIYAFNELLEVYPDARFVFVHRDPLKVLPSVARLTEILRQPFTRKIDRLQIGRQVSDRWLLGSSLLITASESLKSSPERIFHVRYKDLVRNPFEVISALYRHFDLGLSAEGEARIKRYTTEREDGGYGRNHYRFEDYGLNSEAERKRYAPYIEHFQVGSEDGAERRTARPQMGVGLAGAGYE